MARYMVPIGINDYPGVGADLAGCVNDAKDIAAALGERGFEGEPLLDSDATGENIRAALRDVVGRAEYGDVVFISYSGHGSYQADTSGDEPDGRDELWCPHDLWTNGPIVDDELHATFDARKRGVQLIVFSDSCHSGSVVRLAPPLEERSQPRLMRFLPPETFLSTEHLAATRVMQRAPLVSRWRSGALLMAGCEDDDVCWDAWFTTPSGGRRANGAFTRVALTALTEASPRTFAQWHRAIRTYLPSRDFQQVPQLLGTPTQRGWKVP